MTDFNFLSADGATNVTLRTDLIASVPTTENLTICEIYVKADPTNLFANFQKIKYGVGELKQFAIDKFLKLTSTPISKPEAQSTVLNVEVLAAPTGFALTVNSATQITANWTKTPRATGYVLQRATNVGFTTGLTTFTLGDVAVKVDTGLTTGTHYYYRIKATAANATDSTYATDDDTTS